MHIQCHFFRRDKQISIVKKVTFCMPCCLRRVCMSEYVPNEARQKYVPRNLRRESFQDYDAIIFVVDSADKDSFEEARRELWKFLRLLKEIM